MTRALLIAGLTFAFHGPIELAAQRTSAAPQAPGIVIIRSYACGTVNVDSASVILSDTWGANALELIREGSLLDYQILKRIWGDEWNLIEMFVAADDESFQYAVEEIGLRLQVVDSASRARAATFATLCPRQKDSQYSVVSSPF